MKYNNDSREFSTRLIRLNRLNSSSREVPLQIERLIGELMNEGNILGKFTSGAILADLCDFNAIYREDSMRTYFDVCFSERLDVIVNENAALEREMMIIGLACCLAMYKECLLAAACESACRTEVAKLGLTRLHNAITDPSYYDHSRAMRAKREWRQDSFRTFSLAFGVPRSPLVTDDCYGFLIRCIGSLSWAVNLGFQSLSEIQGYDCLGLVVSDLKSRFPYRTEVYTRLIAFLLLSYPKRTREFLAATGVDLDL